jgi:hypothetical protein
VSFRIKYHSTFFACMFHVGLRRHPQEHDLSSFRHKLKWNVFLLN